MASITDELNLNSTRGVLWPVLSCIATGIFSGMILFSLIEIAKVVMNAFPDFDIEWLDASLAWWDSIKPHTRHECGMSTGTVLVQL